MKILTVIGARPQFIKASAVSRALARHPGVEEVLLHTGQHFDANMSEVFFRQMEIPAPRYNLGIASLGHGAMTGRMLEAIEGVILAEMPDQVLVYGDTNSTLAGALAARKLHVPVAHVEAGLRSFNMRMPEEINRILTDRVSDMLFCPTPQAVENLRREGYDQFDAEVVLTGDVMLDAAMHFSSLAVPPQGGLPEDFILVTMHRAENTDDPARLGGILKALATLAESYDVVFPVHPRTSGKIADMGLRMPGRVHITDPLGYLEMTYALRHCQLVMTDSGGVQKEAFFHGRPCVTLREETEWTELVDHGLNVLAGADPSRILDAVEMQLRRRADFNIQLYGDGMAAERIVNRLIAHHSG